MDLLSEINQAENRIRPHIRETILERSPFYSSTGDLNVFFKMENMKHQLDCGITDERNHSSGWSTRLR